MIRKYFSALSVGCAILVSAPHAADVPNVVAVKTVADSEAVGYESYKAMDGDPRTMWHTYWGPGETRHPHDIVLDLGESREISGFSYTPRMGGGNGTIQDFELYVGDSPKDFGPPAITGAFAARNRENVVELPDFTVPARKELFFQALDAEGLAVQSMRSATYLQPGEQLSCQGCHEPRNRTPELPRTVPLAILRAPSKLKPDVDGTNPFSYPRLVQPVLEKNCVSCHAEHPDQAPRLDREVVAKGRQKWYASYHSLAPEYGFWKYGHRHRTVPGKFGARASKLYTMLKDGHHDVELTEGEMHRVTVWLDSCSVFYGVYEKEGGIAQLEGKVVYPTLE